MKNSRKNVFNSIEKIKQLLSRRRLLKKKVGSLMNDVSSHIHKLEGRYLVLFEKGLLHRLKKLFPKNVLFSHHHTVIDFTKTIKLLVDGKEGFARVIRNIEEAKHNIVIQMFIWKNDGIGLKIGQKLLEAAERGVSITIYKDGLGSIFEIGGPGGRGFFKSKINFLWAFISRTILWIYGEPAPDKAPNFSVSDKLLAHKNVRVFKDRFLNDHSKYFLFDDEILILGGMNIGDEYCKVADGKQPRHDYMVEMKSKTVVHKFLHRLKGSFVDDFDHGSSVEFAYNIKVRDSKQFEIIIKFVEFLRLAKKEVIIEMAYLGDPTVTKAIIEAANRGVDVSLIIPQKSNLQDSLNKFVTRKILRNTSGKVSVYLYPKPLHAKALIIDGYLSFLGSTNLNIGALRTLKETNVIVNDADCQFTKRFRETLVHDISISKKVKYERQLGYKSLVAWAEMAIARLF